MASLLDVDPRTVRKLAEREVDERALAALRRRLTLEERVRARAGVA
jgi:hypothetical protein